MAPSLPTLKPFAICLVMRLTVFQLSSWGLLYIPPVTSACFSHWALPTPRPLCLTQTHREPQPCTELIWGGFFFLNMQKKNILYPAWRRWKHWLPTRCQIKMILFQSDNRFHQACWNKTKSQRPRGANCGPQVHPRGSIRPGSWEMLGSNKHFQLFSHSAEH